MKNRYTWAFNPPKKKASLESKMKIKERCDRFLDSTLRGGIITKWDGLPGNVKIVDLHTKWTGNFFYFKAKFECTNPDAIDPFFEEGFARMEYIDEDSFNLSYFRHTGKWWEVYRGLTLDECLEIISDKQLFQP